MRNYDSYKNFVILKKIFRLLSHFQGIIGIIRSYLFQKNSCKFGGLFQISLKVSVVDN